jgi:hypothetical protein
MKGLPSKQKWNHDVGLRNGKEALRRAKKADGEQGAAVREYSELILHILNESATSGDMTTLLRQRTAEEDMKLIETLMAEETR